MKNNEVKEVTTVQDISREFVVKFGIKSSEEDFKWISERMAYWMKEKGDRYYFPPFRSEFAKKFFPELLAKKSKKKKPSLLEEMIAKREAQKKEDK